MDWLALAHGSSPHTCKHTQEEAEQGHSRVQGKSQNLIWVRLTQESKFSEDSIDRHKTTLSTPIKLYYLKHKYHFKINFYLNPSNMLALKFKLSHEMLNCQK